METYLKENKKWVAKLDEMIHMHSHNSILTEVFGMFKNQTIVIFVPIRIIYFLQPLRTIHVVHIVYFSFKMWNRKRRNPKYIPSVIIKRKQKKGQGMISAQTMLVLENKFSNLFNYLINMSWLRVSFSSEQGWVLAVWMSNKWTRKLRNCCSVFHWFECIPMHKETLQILSPIKGSMYKRLNKNTTKWTMSLHGPRSGITAWTASRPA